MSAITLESLGLSQEEITRRVVNNITEHALRRVVQGEDDDDYTHKPTEFAKAVDEQVKVAIDRAITNIAGRHVLPEIERFIENFWITETNQWGEKKGRTFTFVEYLFDRTQAYMTEMVDTNGKGQTEVSEYQRREWRGVQPRMLHYMNKQLMDGMVKALGTVVTEARGTLCDSLTEAVQQTLLELTSKVSVKIVPGDKR